MNKNKLGQLGGAGVLILILASAIVILLFTTEYISKKTFEESINACRFSVIAQSATELAPTTGGMKSPFDINCDKRYVTFYENKVELGLTPINMKPLELNFEGEKKKRFNTLNSYVVNQVIAEELRVCKFQFAEGKIDLFTNEDSNWNKVNVCFICSEINFDEEISPEIFTGLVDYTSKTRFDLSNITYYDYLTEKSKSGNNVWSQPGFDPSIIAKIFGADNKYANLDIDTTKKYVVFYEQAKTANFDLVRWKNPQWVAILPADEINRYCHVQAS